MADAMIPILKDTKDPHYRYKMPKLTAKIEGSGNGIKTVITNMSTVARALDRPASYPTKYFGCELGAQVTMNNDIYVVNGSHDPEKLLNLLYGFIRKFVLCSKCNNPETSLTVSNQIIKQKCIACGHASTIPKTIHKLTTYIINHPPTATVNSSGKNGKSSSKSEKKTKSKSSSSPNGDKKESSNKNDLKVENIDGEDDDGFDDEEFTTDAVAERLLDGLKNGLITDSKESANIFYELVKQKKEANLLQDANVQKELHKEAERLGIKDKSVLILSELLFTENIIEEIKKYRILLLRFCNENRKAQKYLLGGFEKLVGDVYKDTLFNNSLKILKQFYDEDILDEEAIIEWSAKESKKYVSKEMNRKIHEKVAALVKWLKEAEVEDDEEESDEEEEGNKPIQNGSTNNNEKNGNANEDEDDDDMLEFSHRVSGLQIESVKPAVVQKPVNSDGSNDADEADIDIDNI